MNKNGIIGLLVLIILAGGAWVLWGGASKQSASGTQLTGTPMQNDTPGATSTSEMNGSAKPDTLLVGSENLSGTWQSTQDAKYSRVFKADGTVTDSYDGKSQATGTWKLYTAANSLTTIPLEANAVYLQVKDTTPDTETFDYKVQFSADSNTLTLYYLQRGGALEFKRVQ